MGRRGPSKYARMVEESGLLRPTEAAKRLGISYDLLSELVSRGAIKATLVEWDGQPKMLYDPEMIDNLARRSASIGS